MKMCIRDRCDDVRIGISLIFYLQNAADYLRLGCEDNTPHRAKISFSGLSLGGKIILGVYRSNTSQIQKMCEGHEKQELIKQAKEGDQDAIDSLTLDEMDLSSQIRRRIKTEDLYSIVETTFVPVSYTHLDVYKRQVPRERQVHRQVLWSCLTAMRRK